eukprot:3971120-Prymnesium_polylepis.1
MAARDGQRADGVRARRVAVHLGRAEDELLAALRARGVRLAQRPACRCSAPRRASGAWCTRRILGDSALAVACVGARQSRGHRGPRGSRGVRGGSQRLHLLEERQRLCLRADERVGGAGHVRAARGVLAQHERRAVGREHI